MVKPVALRPPASTTWGSTREKRHVNKKREGSEKWAWIVEKARTWDSIGGFTCCSGVPFVETWHSFSQVRMYWKCVYFCFCHMTCSSHLFYSGWHLQFYYSGLRNSAYYCSDSTNLHPVYLITVYTSFRSYPNTVFCVLLLTAFWYRGISHPSHSYWRWVGGWIQYEKCFIFLNFENFCDNP